MPRPPDKNEAKSPPLLQQYRCEWLGLNNQHLVCFCSQNTTGLQIRVPTTQWVFRGHISSWLYFYGDWFPSLPFKKRLWHIAIFLKLTITIVRRKSQNINFRVITMSYDWIWSSFDFPMCVLLNIHRWRDASDSNWLWGSGGRLFQDLAGNHQLYQL